MFLSLILSTFFIFIFQEGNATFADQCRNHTVRFNVKGKGLASLMNMWGEKYAAFRRDYGFDVKINYYENAVYKAIPPSKQPRLWFQITHTSDVSKADSILFFFPYLVR